MEHFAKELIYRMNESIKYISDKSDILPKYVEIKDYRTTIIKFPRRCGNTILARTLHSILFTDGSILIDVIPGSRNLKRLDREISIDYFFQNYGIRGFEIQWVIIDNYSEIKRVHMYDHFQELLVTFPKLKGAFLIG